MDDKKEPRELTDQEKEILTKMENAESEEELMKLIEEIQKESKDANVTITPIKVPSKKFFLIRFIIECLLVGLVAGFFITKTIFEKQLKKNPPINRNMIKALYSQMGRKPSEKDINRIMESMNKYK